MIRILTTTERDFFVAYLAGLGEAGIPCAIARNHDGFPERMGNDVDMIIPRRCRKMAADLFRRLVRKFEGHIWKENYRDFILDVRFVMPDSTKVIHLDIYWGVFTWHGLYYVEDDAVFSQAVLRGGYKAVRPAHEIMGMYSQSLLWGSFFGAKYNDRMREVLEDKDERDEFYRTVKTAYGTDTLPFPPGGQPLPSPKEARTAGATLRSRLKKTALKRRPFLTAWRLFRYWLGEVLTLFRPSGVNLAFIGPDGSGKSTLIDEVEKKLFPIFLRIRRFHFRPKVLPDPGVAIGSREETKGPNTEPYARPPHSNITGFLRLCWFVLDYWIGQVRIWRGLGLSEIITFDRHASDMLCDPLRYRFKLPRWLLRLAVALVPKPTHTFVLIADADTLARRKGETPPENAARLIEAYESFAANGGDKVHRLDATRSVEENVLAVEKIVVQLLLKKYDR